MKGRGQDIPITLSDETDHLKDFTPNEDYWENMVVAFVGESKGWISIF